MFKQIHKNKYKNKINNKLCLISLFTRAHKCSTCSFIESHYMYLVLNIMWMNNGTFSSSNLLPLYVFVFALLFVKVAPLWHSGMIWTKGGFRYPNAIYLDASSSRKILVTEYCFAYLSKFRNFRFFGTLRVHNKPVYGTISGTCDLIISNFPWSFMINMKCATFVYLNTCV